MCLHESIHIHVGLYQVRHVLWISDILKRLNIRRSIQAFRQEYATEEDEDKDGNDFSSEDNAMASTSLDWAAASKVH